MQPKIIKYDATGRPLTKQVEVMSEYRTEENGWSAFIDTSCMVDALEETAIKCLILSHIHMLHRRLPAITEKHLNVAEGGTRGGGVRVIAVKAMGAGFLRMAPLVTGAASFLVWRKLPQLHMC